ncbi:MAG: cytochrome c3 family protein [Steroidobacter sp.]
MAGASKRVRYWCIWAGTTAAVAIYLAAGMLRSNAAIEPLLAPARRLLMPGETTHGHYQIELVCESCHTQPFSSGENLQAACESCHDEALQAAEDKHPLSKFADPRNEPLLANVDASRCVTCHAEHRPEITSAMGVTLPADVCAHCHAKIAVDRPSHAGMEFDTCASAGCHNFHDNRALYEDFLLRHLHEPETRASGPKPALDYLQVGTMLPSYPSQRYPLVELQAKDADAHKPGEVVNDWLASSHARAGVNCSACHGEQTSWTDQPEPRACATCHDFQVDGFLAGRHGMRAATMLGPMAVADARLPMHESATDKHMGCTSCHGAHGFDASKAVAEACLGCHADEHSVAWRDSPHARQKDPVTCADCHMPRVRRRDAEFDVSWTAVEHNQNDTLRPNEKMIRPVCLNCHGLAFAIDALADPELIRRNFAGRPSRHVPSLDMAETRLREHEAGRAVGQRE